MSSVNKVFILGRAPKKPIEYKTQNGELFTSLNIPVNKKTKNQEMTTWIPVLFFGKTAEIAINYMDKGKLVLVEGEITIREKTNDAGFTYKETSVICNKLTLLSPSSSTQESNNDYSREQLDKELSTVVDDDIPF